MKLDLLHAILAIYGIGSLFAGLFVGLYLERKRAAAIADRHGGDDFEHGYDYDGPAACCAYSDAARSIAREIRGEKCP